MFAAHESDLTDLPMAEVEHYRHELDHLRQVILQAEPSVLLDGRFEAMITTPTAVIGVARDLIRELQALRRMLAAAEAS